MFCVFVAYMYVNTSSPCGAFARKLINTIDAIKPETPWPLMFPESSSPELVTARVSRVAIDNTIIQTERPPKASSKTCPPWFLYRDSGGWRLVSCTECTNGTPRIDLYKPGHTRDVAVGFDRHTGSSSREKCQTEYHRLAGLLSTNIHAVIGRR